MAFWFQRILLIKKCFPQIKNSDTSTTNYLRNRSYKGKSNNNSSDNSSNTSDSESGSNNKVVANGFNGDRVKSPTGSAASSSNSSKSRCSQHQQATQGTAVVVQRRQKDNNGSFSMTSGKPALIKSDSVDLVDCKLNFVSLA